MSILPSDICEESSDTGVWLYNPCAIKLIVREFLFPVLFFNLALLFWNHILIWDSVSSNWFANLCLLSSVRYLFSSNSFRKKSSWSLVKAVRGRFSSAEVDCFSRLFILRDLGPGTHKRTNCYYFFRQTRLLVWAQVCHWREVWVLLYSSLLEPQLLVFVDRGGRYVTMDITGCGRISLLLLRLPKLPSQYYSKGPGNVLSVPL